MAGMAYAGSDYIATRKDVSGTFVAHSNTVTSSPPSASSAIIIGNQSKITHTTSDITGSGHVVAQLDYLVINAASKTIGLCIAHEAKYDNLAGTATTAVICESQVGTHSGVSTDIINFRAHIEENIGTITTNYGFLYNDISALSGITTKYSFINIDPGAPIYNLATTLLYKPILFCDFTFATLPSAATYTDMCAMCNDNGAGNNPCIVRSNGTNWILADNTGTLAS